MVLRLINYQVQRSSQLIRNCQRRSFRIRSRNVSESRKAWHFPSMLCSRGSPGNALLSEVLNSLPEIASLQTDPQVWSARTLDDAWKTLHSILRDTSAECSKRIQELQESDLKALALCTSYVEVKSLLDVFAPSIRAALVNHTSFASHSVEEFFMHLGQEIEVRGDKWCIQLPPPTLQDLQFTLSAVGNFGEDGRGCLPSTSHRISLWRGRNGEPLGVTVRVGRYVPRAARAILPLTEKGNVLIIAKAGLGKTTLLRDLASSIANNPLNHRVTVVDTSNEIGGDGPVPLSFLGRCRRIQVPQRADQGRLMSEVIQNHTPDYLIVDELVTETEAEAAWSISQRGVRLIATCHGKTLENLLQNQSLKLLVGGTAQAFLSNEERRIRQKEKKTILERPYSSPFDFVVEIIDRKSAFVYVNVNKAVDLILDDQSARAESSVGDFVSLLDDLSPRLLQKVEDSSSRVLQKKGKGASLSSATQKFNKGGEKSKADRRVLKSSKEVYDELADFL